jgi:hypothetical protein
MELAILFWFYKELDICKNHLEILRQNNPNTPIYGLYGGDIASVDQYQAELGEYLDDFYVFPDDEKDSSWKWIQGDLILTHWFRERGKDLKWDSVIIVQWDMLVFGAVEQLFSMLKKDQILLSGIRQIKEVENDWMWVTPKDPERRQKYLEFIEYITNTYDYHQEPMACIFIVVCLPRFFLERYAYVEQSELGFLEYRIPIYAQIFDIPFCENHPFQTYWGKSDLNNLIFRTKNPLKRILNALEMKLNPIPLSPSRRDISLIPIYRHLNHKEGSRIFHPYRQLFPKRKRHLPAALLKEFSKDLDWLPSVLSTEKKS